MSREERRAYQRMTKNRDPYALPAQPAQRARIERARAKRDTRPSTAFRFITGRFLAWAVGGAAIAGLIAFSVAWPGGMPGAAYVGIAGAAAWVVMAVGVRVLQRRALSQR